MDKSLVLKIYQKMVTLQTMDSLFFEAQRQGRFSFYLTSFGEEAITIASAAAINDDDMVYAQVNCDKHLLYGMCRLGYVRDVTDFGCSCYCDPCCDIRACNN